MLGSFTDFTVSWYMSDFGRKSYDFLLSHIVSDSSLTTQVKHLLILVCLQGKEQYFRLRARRDQTFLINKLVWHFTNWKLYEFLLIVRWGWKISLQEYTVGRFIMGFLHTLDIHVVKHQKTHIPP